MVSLKWWWSSWVRALARSTWWRKPKQKLVPCPTQPSVAVTKNHFRQRISIPMWPSRFGIKSWLRTLVWIGSVFPRWVVALRTSTWPHPRATRLSMPRRLLQRAAMDLSRPRRCQTSTSPMTCLQPRIGQPPCASFQRCCTSSSLMVSWWNWLRRMLKSVTIWFGSLDPLVPRMANFQRLWREELTSRSSCSTSIGPQLWSLLEVRLSSVSLRSDLWVQGGDPWSL